jgi:predicted phage-related endonuclease
MDSDNKKLYIEYNERLNNLKSDIYKVDDISKLNNSMFEYELINLPNKEYSARVLMCNVNRELEDIKLEHQKLIDSNLKYIYEDKSIKNQFQRDLKQRDILKDSDLHIIYTSIEEVLIDTIRLLKEQADYYFNMCTNLKKIYSVRNEYLSKDKMVYKE